MAGLRAGLLGNLADIPGARILDGKFTSVQQAIGVRKGRGEGLKFLSQFVADAKVEGLVGKLINQFGVDGRLTVAP